MRWEWSKNMSGGSYYVPEKSRFPIFMAFSLFLLVMGASSFINNNLGDSTSQILSTFYMLVLALFFNNVLLV